MPYKHGVTGSSPVVPTNKKAHQDDVLFLLYGTIYGREPENLFSAFGGCLQTLALCPAISGVLKGGPRGILCTRGEKAHTSIRVNIIDCDNAILKVQCAP